MPLIDVHVMEGVFTPEVKARMIASVTRGFAEVAGEAMMAATSIRIHDVPAGNWGYAGQVFSFEEAMALKARG